VAFHKQIICLANSRKYAGRCIAGKELRGQEVGPWIRPVSRREMGEFTLPEISFGAGGLPKVLDIITVPLLKPHPHTYQRENYLVDVRQRWLKRGVWPSTALAGLCDPVDSLWPNGYHSVGGHNDRIPHRLTESEISSSLLFIKPERLAIVVREEYNTKKIRAEFTFNRNAYRFTVTDPAVERKYLSRKAGLYRVDKPEVYLCLSIGEPFHGYCYKLVAAVFNLF
jgi:hypothetical protein